MKNKFKDLNATSFSIKNHQKRKCIRVRLENVKMVVGQDIGTEKVEFLMNMALVGRFMGKKVKGETLKQWLDLGWRRNLGYILMFQIQI
jgi:hypothetical protein